MKINFFLKPWKNSLSKIFKFSDVFLKYWLYSVDYRPKKVMPQTRLLGV